MILRAWPAGRLCFPAGFLFPLAPRRSQGFLRICRAPESGRSLAPAGQFTLRRQTRFKHPGPEPRCRRQTEGEAPCARERKERPGALQRGHCELRRSPRYRKRKAGHCPASGCRKTPGGSGAAAPGGFDRIWRHARQIRKKPCVARVSLHSSLAAP